MQIEYYETLEEMPLYNWDRYLATNCNNWFISNFNGRQKIIESEELTILEVKLHDDYFKLLNDASFILKLQKWARIEALSSKYSAIVAILKRFELGFSIEEQEHRAMFIKTLGKSGFKMPLLNNYEGDLKEIELIFTKIQSIKTQISILQVELKEEGQQEKQSLQKQLLLVSKGLQLGYRLNPKEINIAEWIEMTKMMKEKPKQIN